MNNDSEWNVPKVVHQSILLSILYHIKLIVIINIDLFYY